MAPHGDDHVYHPVDAVKAGTKGAMITGGAGLLAASVQNAMRKSNVGALGVFTRSGGLIFTWAAAGGALEFSTNAAANLRQKKDHYNAGIGGFLAGSVLGMKVGRMPAIFGYGALTSVLITAYEYTGASLRGKNPWANEDDGLDEFERREQTRKPKRRPIEQTIAEIGEGRGIEPPGFKERRKERLEAKYGVKIEPVSADVV